jgi:hypothetical protein
MSLLSGLVSECETTLGFIESRRVCHSIFNISCTNDRYQLTLRASIMLFVEKCFRSIEDAKLVAIAAAVWCNLTAVDLYAVQFAASGLVDAVFAKFYSLVPPDRAWDLTVVEIRTVAFLLGICGNIGRFVRQPCLTALPYLSNVAFRLRNERDIVENFVKYFLASSDVAPFRGITSQTLLLVLKARDSSTSSQRFAVLYAIARKQLFFDALVQVLRDNRGEFPPFDFFELFRQDYISGPHGGGVEPWDRVLYLIGSEITSLRMLSCSVGPSFLVTNCHLQYMSHLVKVTLVHGMYSKNFIHFMATRVFELDVGYHRPPTNTNDKFGEQEFEEFSDMELQDSRNGRPLHYEDEYLGRDNRYLREDDIRGDIVVRKLVIPSAFTELGTMVMNLACCRDITIMGALNGVDLLPHFFDPFKVPYRRVYVKYLRRVKLHEAESILSALKGNKGAHLTLEISKSFLRGESTGYDKLLASKSRQLVIVNGPPERRVFELNQRYDNVEGCNIGDVGV